MLTLSWHERIQQQLRAHGLENTPLPEPWASFVAEISNTYRECEEERERLRRDAEVSAAAAAEARAEQRRNEDELRKSERRLRDAQRLAQLGSWECDMATRTMTWSEELCSLYGMTLETAPTTLEGALAMVHPEDRPALQVMAREALEGGRDFTSCHRIIRRDSGAVRVMSSRGRLVVDEEGHPLRLVGTAQDVTELKAAEAALKESECRFRQMAESIRGVFWMADPIEHRMLYISPAYEAIFGRSCQSWYDDPHEYFRAIHPDDKPRAFAAVEKHMRGEATDETYRIVTSDGSIRWMHGRAVPLRDANGRIYRITGMVEDVTDKKNLEERLLESQKMDAVGRLAGGVAHDFNNLLTVILGYGHQLSSGHLEPSTSRRVVGEIVRAAERAGALTAQLLAFSRRQVLKPTVLDLNNVVGEMEKLLRRLISEDIEFVTRPDPKLGLVRADRTQIEQVILNLVVNARDAMPQGGRLRLETRQVPARQVPGSPADGPSHYAAVIVTDTGTGMDETTRSRVFEPFFTTKGPGRGTGLGLATVYGIVRQSGGSIHVDSAPGRGSTFTAFLPCTNVKPEEASGSGDTRPLQRGSGTVLLVEDEEAVRNMVREVLEAQGYAVLAASNATAALVICRAVPQAIDVLVTDVVMPDLSGPKLAEQIAALRPGIKVLFMSGYTDHPVLTDGGWTPGMAFVQKPFAPDAFVRKIQETMQRA